MIFNIPQRGHLNCEELSKYGIMTEEFVIHSYSQMMSFEIIMPLELQSTLKALLRDALHCLGW